MPRTLRTRLTLLYAIPFLASGALLLGVPILSFSQTSPVGQFIGPRPNPEPGPERIIGTSAAVLVAMLVVALVLGWLISGRFLRPLRAITATARDISASNLHRRLGPTGRNDEFTELAATLDDLFARLEAAFASQRRFIANASHELRTPLTAERSLLQVALADPDATVDSLRAAGEEVLALGRAQEQLIDGLLQLASGEQGLDRREALDLAAIASFVLQQRDRGRVTVVTDLAPAPTTGDASLVESLVANLVENAVRHNVVHGSVLVQTSTVDGQASLMVRNTGPLVPPEELDRLLQPFQTLGQDRMHREGHGLGLAIVKAIADTHQAALRVRAQPEGGLAVTVCFL